MDALHNDESVRHIFQRLKKYHFKQNDIENTIQKQEYGIIRKSEMMGVVKMNINNNEQSLPPVYKRQGSDYYLDPIRKRLIKVTPEEVVRQKVVSYLLNDLKVPTSMIRVEEHLSHYGIKSKRRADIIVEKLIEEERSVVPLLVIECKAPDVFVGESTVNQMLDYTDLLFNDYAMATNGNETVCMYYNAETNSYEVIEEIPKYIDMIKGEFKAIPEIPLPPRLSLEQIEEADNWKSYQGAMMGTNTSKDILVFAVNLWEALLYTDHKLPIGGYKLFTLIEDYGVRMLEYGNASGGTYSGAYRSFLIDYNGSTEFVSIGMSSYVTWAHPDVEKTVLNVAVDNEIDSHHSLQLVLDDNLEKLDNKYTLYHHGRIAIGNIGSGKISELREYVRKKYPEIIEGTRFNLGTLVNNHLFCIDQSDMVKIVENLISYALIRDEYRKEVKRR